MTQLFLFYLILFLIQIGLISFLNRNIINRFDFLFHKYIVIFILFFGVLIHEISHWIACKLLRMRVIKFRLFENYENGEFGYVQFGYNKENVIHRIGTIVIGMAPLTLILPIIAIILNYILKIDLRETEDKLSKLFQIYFDKKNDLIEFSRYIILLFLSFFEKFFKKIIEFYNSNNFVLTIVVIYFLTSLSLNFLSSKSDFKAASIGFIFILILATVSILFFDLIRKGVFVEYIITINRNYFSYCKTIIYVNIYKYIDLLNNRIVSLYKKIISR